MPRPSTVLLSAFALGALVAAAAPARADLMTDCAPEISRFCGDISQGRGRISACLASRMGTLGAACAPSVRAVAGSRFAPADVRKIFDPGFRAALPAVCVKPAASFCPGVPVGDGRVFACLYARSDRVDATCSDAARATVQRTN